MNGLDDQQQEQRNKPGGVPGKNSRHVAFPLMFFFPNALTILQCRGVLVISPTKQNSVQAKRGFGFFLDHVFHLLNT
jgi:hypothetical protein